ncbi:hypothetical protein ES703_74305 [subsurface metagenome]
MRLELKVDLPITDLDQTRDKLLLIELDPDVPRDVDIHGEGEYRYLSARWGYSPDAYSVETKIEKNLDYHAIFRTCCYGKSKIDKAFERIDQEFQKVVKLYREIKRGGVS